MAQLSWGTSTILKGETLKNNKVEHIVAFKGKYFGSSLLLLGSLAEKGCSGYPLLYLLN